MYRARFGALFPLAFLFITTTRVLLTLAVILCLLPSQAWSSIAPTSAGLSLGYSNDLGPGSDDWTPVPMVVTTWRFAEHLSIRSSVSYLQERKQPASFWGGAETRRDHFVPLAAGIRLSAGSASAGSGGLFLEVSPAAYIAQISTSVGSPSTEVLAGYQIGWGFRVLAFDGSHAELGITYYRSEAADPEPRISDGHPGVNAADLYVTVGFGR